MDNRQIATEKALKDLLYWSKKLEDYSLDQLTLNPIPNVGIKPIDHVAEVMHTLWLSTKKADKKLRAFSELSRNLQKLNNSAEGRDYCLDLISDELRVSDSCLLVKEGDSYNPSETCFLSYLNEPIPKAWLDSVLRKSLEGVVVLNEIDCVDSSLCFNSSTRIEKESSHFLFARIGSWDEIFMFHRSVGSPRFSIFDEELVKGLCQLVSLMNENNELYQDVLQAKAELHRLNSELVDLNVSLEQQVRDRTFDLSKAKERAEEAQLAAEKANGAKSDFLAMMSHEIRTPMNGVLGMAQLLEATTLSEEQENYVKTIQSAGQLLLTLINDILDYSKIESGQMEIESQPFSMEECIRDISHIFQNMAEQKSLEFSIELDSKISEMLMGDRLRLRQVLINLCNNAIKFTSEGSVKVEIERLPKTEWATEKIYFSITDTGIGVSPEQLSKLFKPFSQATASTARQYGGTGLGLAIAKKLVNAMGGEIGVHSKQGKGSVFWFIIPAMPVASAVVHEIGLKKAESEELAAEAKRHAMGNVGLKEDFNILVVEDNKINQMTIKAMLGKEGFECVLAETGEKAIEAFEEKTWDLIFMDCFLPGINGYDTTRRIRELERENGSKPIPIIALTANAMEEDKERCMEAGMDGFISKPIRKATLHDMLAHYFQG